MNYDVTLPETDQSFTADLSLVIKGDKGDPGDTPVRGVDYWTDADKAEIVKALSEDVLGDIDTALDSIIAIQNALIGGDGI